MPHATSHSPIDDPGALIDEDLLCRGCGYNLRGLTRNHYCPECHTPSSQSVTADRLVHADFGWLRTVRKGIVVYLWMIGLMVLMIFRPQGILGSREEVLIDVR